MRIFKALIPSLGFALLLSACDGLMAQGPGTRVVKAMELIRDGKRQALDDYVLREDVSGAGFIYGLMSLAFAEKGGVVSIQLETESISGESARVTVRWHYKSGGTSHETFPLKREDGKWRIDL